MPVIGAPSRFAIEYDLDENSGGVWMYGRFCYWCGGGRVGDYELVTTLRDVLFALDGLAKDKHLRASQRFMVMSATDVFRLLDAALFGLGDLNTGQVAVEEQWARHTIFPGVEVFNGCKGFLLEDQQTARLIFAQDPYQDVRELALKTGEVDAVLDVVRSALDDIYERALHTVQLSGMDVVYLANTGFLPADLARIVESAERFSDEARVLRLDRDTAERFRDEFTVRLARVGFGPNYEPTSEGKRLEDLIDRFAG